MKGFYIYIIVMAVVMCGYSVVLLTMAKKKKKRCTRMVRTKS